MKVLFLCKCLFFPIMYQRICLKHPESSEAFKSELQVKLARERKCIFLTIWEVSRQINLWFLTTDLYVSNVPPLRSCSPLTKLRFHSTSFHHTCALDVKLSRRQSNLTAEAAYTVHDTQEPSQLRAHSQTTPLSLEPPTLPAVLDVPTPLPVRYSSICPMHASQTKCSQSFNL